MARHGQTEHNVAGLLSSDDTPLTILGGEQAKAAEAIVSKILDEKDCEIFTSDLPRAKHTAMLMVDRLPHHLTPVAGINERHMGEEAGQTHYDDYWLRFGDAVRNHRDPIAEFKGMESIGDHRNRALAAISKRLSASPENRVPAFICHEGVIRRVVESMGIEGSKFQNAGVYHFEPEGETGWRISQVELKQDQLHERVLWNVDSIAAQPKRMVG